MQLKSRELTPKQQVRASVMAAMETGNADYARTVLTEYEAVSSAEAMDLKMEVVAAYGVFL